MTDIRNALLATIDNQKTIMSMLLKLIASSAGFSLDIGATAEYKKLVDNQNRINDIVIKDLNKNIEASY
jgi:hypothetical protein